MYSIKETLQNVMDNITAVPCVKVETIDETNLYFDEILPRSNFMSSEVEDLETTILFILKNFGKGVYIKIINNKLDCFIPFKNFNFKGYFKDRTDFGNITILDNFIIKNYDIDTDVMWIKDFIIMVCENRNISDCEFFLNSELNYPIVGGDVHVPANIHTIFSFNVSPHFYDLAFPSFVDFQRILKNNFGIEDFKTMKWDDKNVEFLYKGDILNDGIYSDKYPVNQKLAVIKFMKENYPEISNVSITKFYENTPIVVNNIVYFFEKQEFFKNQQHVDVISKSKFIFAIDGVGYPEELSMLLFSGSCVIRVQSEWFSWYDFVLEEDIHFVSVKSDLSNLKEKIEWCLNNDEKCKQIGLNAREFSLKYLTRNGIFDYMQLIMNKFVNRLNRKTSLSTLQAEHQRLSLENYFVSFSNIPYPSHLDATFLSKYTREWQWNNALSILLYKDRNFKELSSYFVKYVHKNPFDGMNDAFIGINAINLLTKDIPNFCFTYFVKTENEKVVVFRERMYNCYKLDNFLKSNPDKFTEIFIQIFLSLQLAYERLCFEHGNLAPENILVKELQQPIKILYRLESKTWAISTKFIPIICDFSKSKILSNFSNKVYKINRMFIGRNEDMDDTYQNEFVKDDVNEINNKINGLLHVSGAKDSRYLLKKLGKKIYTKISNLDEPETAMKKTITKKDILDADIKFGAVTTDEEIPGQNTRFIYDSIVGDVNAVNNVADRIFQNGLPNEKTSIGNAIVEYELIQNLKSSLGNINLKITVDVETSQKIQSCMNFVRKNYRSVIEDTFSESLMDLIDTGDLFNLKIFILKYLTVIFRNSFSKKMWENLLKVAISTIGESIRLGIENTKAFYMEN